jgi:transposase
VFMKEVLGFTEKEMNRIMVLEKVKNKLITQSNAAKQLRISERQIHNLLKSRQKHGDKALISKKRGAQSNRAYEHNFKNSILNIVRNHYPDFGPQLANEYLKENYKICISTETLRKWMIECHLWIPRKDPGRRVHLLRARRGSFGELIQVDGSHHDWFEGRLPPCVLMVFIDDATSTITSLHFANTESLEAYFKAFEKHLIIYGIPLGIYGDRCAVLTQRNPKNTGDRTQFQKALKDLNCELILALSPQAKGRVERANRTLQDRLVKELRLRGISSLEEANDMLEEFRVNYNKLFSKEATKQEDVHRSLEGICLDEALSIRWERTLSKDNTLQFKNNFYLISGGEKLFKGAKVEIRELRNGEVVSLLRGKRVKMTKLSEVESKILDGKEIFEWKERKHYIPPSNHPYKRYYSQARFG